MTTVLAPNRQYSTSPPSSPSRAPDTSLPTQTFHRASSLTMPFLHDSLSNSAIGGAHSSGVDPIKERRLSMSAQHRASVSSPTARHASVHFERGEDDESAEGGVHEAVMADLLELYEGRPSAEIFERRFARNAVFEDPFVLCKGVHELAPQFFSLAHVMSRSKTLSRRVLSLPEDHDCIIFSQKQEYVFRFTGRKQVVDSIVRVELDGAGRITRLIDEWNGKPASSGWMALTLRRLNARLVPLVPWLANAPSKQKQKKDK